MDQSFRRQPMPSLWGARPLLPPTLGIALAALLLIWRARVPEPLLIAGAVAVGLGLAWAR